MGRRQGNTKFDFTKILLVLAVFCMFFSIPLPVKASNTDEKSDLRLILRDLAKSGGMRLLMDASVKGVVTTKPRANLLPKAALELLAKTYGYSYKWVEDGETMVVGTAAALKGLEEEETIEYQLNQISPDEFLQELKSVVPRERIEVNQEAKKIVITGNRLEHANITDLLSYYDQSKTSLLWEVRLATVTGEGLNQITSARASGNIGSSDSGLRFNIVKADILAELGEGNHLRLLANEGVMMENPREGRVFIGDQYPVLITRITAQGVEELIDYRKVGVDLRLLLPELEETVITTNLSIEVNRISHWQKSGTGPDLPVISKISGSAGCRLRTGEALVLTGFSLLREGDEERVPPGLLDLPVLGKVIRGGRQLTGDPKGSTHLCLVLGPRSIPVEMPARQEQIEKEEGLQPATTPGAAITTEIYSLTGEAGGVGEPVTQVYTEVQGFGGVETKKTVEESTAAQDEVPAIKVVVTDGADPFKEDTLKPDSTEENSTTDGMPLPPTVGSEVPTGLNIPYAVKKGDTVYGVARKFGIHPNGILEVNKLSTSSVLAVGQPLVIPIPVDHLYQLQPQETLWRVAKRYGLEVELLMEINSLADPTTLRTGQVIILPVSVSEVLEANY